MHGCTVIYVVYFYLSGFLVFSWLHTCPDPRGAHQPPNKTKLNCCVCTARIFSVNFVIENCGSVSLEEKNRVAKFLYHPNDVRFASLCRKIYEDPTSTMNKYFEWSVEGRQRSRNETEFLLSAWPCRDVWVCQWGTFNHRRRTRAWYTDLLLFNVQNCWCYRGHASLCLQ